MIVVDTNVIGYLFLSSEQSVFAEQTLQKDRDWAAPILWRSEFRNVLTFYLQKKIIKLEQAQKIMNGALKLLGGRECGGPKNSDNMLSSDPDHERS